MRKEPTIAEVLHYAADCCLWGGEVLPGEVYSCHAVNRAANELTSSKWSAVTVRRKIFEGLRKMGLDTYAMDQFAELTGCINRQAARYVWLKFAALIAEEQGV